MPAPKVLITGKGMNIGDIEAKREQFVAINPSILIGIGGTGKHVLLTLRRKFFEKFGVKGFPVIGYLWVDTDMQNIGIDGEKLDYSLQQVMFEPNEVIDAQIGEQEFHNYFSYKPQYPHIWRWLFHTIEQYGTAQHGARQIRPLGRLAFFHHYEKIVQSLLDLKAKITSQTVVQDTERRFNIKVDPDRFTVYIICSLAGGTGSGMFLDMAFAVKDLFPDTIRIGYLVLPSVFSNDPSARIFANAYAALKELEFYNLRKDFINKSEAEAAEAESSFHDFEVEWIRGQRKRIMGPPFTVYYLIDNKTSQGTPITLEHKKQLLDMVAENIFLDFAAPQPFGSLKRSIQANIHPSLMEHYILEYLAKDGSPAYTSTFSLHNASFGLSKIYIPIDKIKKACGLKLAMDIIDYWTGKPEETINVASHLKDLMNEIGLGAHPERIIISHLEKIEGTSIESVIHQWISELSDKIQKILKKSPRRVEQIVSEEIEGFYKERMSCEGAREGLFCQSLKVNAENLFDELQRKIVLAAGHYLARPGFKFFYTIELLRELKNKIDTIRERFERELLEVEKKAERMKREFEEKLNLYRMVESRFTYLKTVTLSYVAQHMLKRLEKRTIYDFRRMLLEKAIDFLRKLGGFVGYRVERADEEGNIIVEQEGLIKKISDIEEKLRDEIRASLEFKYDSYVRQEEEVINVSLYKEELIDSYYEIDGIRISQDRTIIPKKAEEFLTQLKYTLIGLSEFIHQYGSRKLEEELENFCLRPFMGMKAKHEIIKMLYDENSISPEERARIITKFVRNGHPWIKQTQQFIGNPAILRGYMATFTLLGVYKGEHEAYERFKKEVNKNRIQTNYFQSPEVDKDTVYFFSEWVGFPLLFIDGMKNYKEQAYIPWMEEKQAELHIDRNYEKFEDIVPMEQEDLENYLDAYRTLIFGYMLNVLNIEERKDPFSEHISFHYSFEEEIAPEVKITVPLGEEYFAIEKLKRDERLREKIKSLIERKKLSLVGESMFQYYVLLIDQRNNIFPRKYKWTSSNPLEVFSFENRVIEEEIQNLSRQFTGDAEEIRRRIEFMLKQIDLFTERIGESGRRRLKF